jgi:hypothetical protein
MNRFTTSLAAACFAATASFAFAQAPAGDAGKGPGPMGHRGGERMLKPCAQEADPAKCESMRQERRAQARQAYESCKDKPDRRACMAEQYCAKSEDPAKCQARAGEHGARMSKRMDEHQAAAEACTGKRGDELRQCMQAQRPKTGRGAPDKRG